MVRGLLPNVSDHHAPNEPAADAPPVMFKRQSDVPDPMASVRHGDQVAKLHREWIRITSPPSEGSRSPKQRLGHMARRFANRFPGTVDQVFIADLIRAVDAVAARCDEISDRLEHQTIVLDDAITIFGEELTRMRADVAHLVDRDGERSLPPASNG
jgi:hypothetical protein